MEAIPRERLATVIQESQDGSGKICNKDMFNLDYKKLSATRRYYDTKCSRVMVVESCSGNRVFYIL